MRTRHQSAFRAFVLCLLMALALISLAACSPAGSGSDTGESGSQNNVEHEEDAEHEDATGHDDDAEHEEDEAQDRVPNNGATISIISPAAGATFAEGDEIVVEVEVANFELAGGAHWHVYVDDSSWGMVMDGHLDHVLRGLEAGEHEIAVFLAGADHIQLEEGDSTHITVTAEED